MPLETEKLCGRRLPNQPDNISRCGMSVAKYARHRETERWYELLETGDIIGSPLQLDFYTPAESTGPQKQSQSAEKQLVEV